MIPSGIFAQSVGGGGGSGGFSVTGGISASGAAVGASIGGTGAGGGNAGYVAVGATINSTSANALPCLHGNAVSGDIITYGNHSYGIIAQSIGGSGGDGGFSVAGGISASSSVNFSMGGSGGSAGAAGDVVLDSASSVNTSGTGSHAIFAQSVGGGGGSGGFSVAGGISASGAAIGVSLGGDGSAGGNAAAVTLISSGSNIITNGDRSDGILAQSVGGGGGDGGFSVTGNASQSAAIGFSMGGSGSSVERRAWSALPTPAISPRLATIPSASSRRAWVAAAVRADSALQAGFRRIAARWMQASAARAVAADPLEMSSFIPAAASISSTGGDRSSALVAQSIGGGGGAGGFSIAGGLSNSASVNFSMGGGGGTGGNAGAVVLTSTSALFTSGTDSHGILAQSVGGGGGAGGFSVTGGLSTSSGAVSVSLGGTGGSGGNARCGQRHQRWCVYPCWRLLVEYRNAPALAAHTTTGQDFTVVAVDIHHQQRHPRSCCQRRLSPLLGFIHHYRWHVCQHRRHVLQLGWSIHDQWRRIPQHGWNPFRRHPRAEPRRRRRRWRVQQ